jgi:hypothetical protein
MGSSLPAGRLLLALPLAPPLAQAAGMIRAGLRHASMRSDNIYSVAYWYQKEPHAPFAALPPVEQRIPKTIWTGGAGQDPKMK